MPSQRVSSSKTTRSGVDRVATTAQKQQTQKQQQNSTRSNVSSRKGSQASTRKALRTQAAQAASVQLETGEANEVQVQKPHTQVQKSRPGLSFATTFDDIAITISGVLAYAPGLGVRPPATA